VYVFDGQSHSPILPSLPAKSNILIDQTGHARLADFGLLTIVSDPANLLSSSSYTQGGTARWMGPELIDPQRFGFENSCPTKSSDCYALGMVIYETISGSLPFHKHTDLTVFVKVLAGERPPRGAGFAEGLWKMLELCWKPQPNSRPSIEDVLRCLEMISNPSELRSRGVDVTGSRSILATSGPLMQPTSSPFPANSLPVWHQFGPYGVVRSPQNIYNSSSSTTVAANGYRPMDIWNVSPFVGDIGQIRIGDGSAFREVWAGMDDQKGEHVGGGSATTSRRRSVNVVQGRRPTTIGFNAPGSYLEETSRSGFSQSHGGPDLLFVDDDRAGDLGSLNIGGGRDDHLNGLSRGTTSKPSSLPIHAPIPHAPATDLLAYNVHDGRGVPLHAVPSHWHLYIVEFKAGRTDLFYSTELAGEIRLADFVIVEADRGKDLGKVVNDTIMLKEVIAFAQKARASNAGGGEESGIPGGGSGGSKTDPKKIFGKARTQDIQ
jgi:hypothetical protein